MTLTAYDFGEKAKVRRVALDIPGSSLVYPVDCARISTQPLSVDGTSRRRISRVTVLPSRRPGDSGRHLRSIARIVVWPANDQDTDYE